MGDRGGDPPPGGIEVVWREEAGWQVEEMGKFGLNIVSFLLTLGAWRWYVVGAYVPPKNMPMLHQAEQALEAKQKGVETILLEDINACIG